MKNRKFSLFQYLLHTNMEESILSDGQNSQYFASVADETNYSTSMKSYVALFDLKQVLQVCLMCLFAKILLFIMQLRSFKELQKSQFFQQTLFWRQ